jgi:hypothetical protein
VSSQADSNAPYLEVSEVFQYWSFHLVFQLSSNQECLRLAKCSVRCGIQVSPNSGEARILVQRCQDYTDCEPCGTNFGSERCLFTNQPKTTYCVSMVCNYYSQSLQFSSLELATLTIEN